MPSPDFLSESPPRASRTVRDGSAAAALWAVNQRLAGAERELRIQFTRIAQLQAQLDLLAGGAPILAGWRPGAMSVSGAAHLHPGSANVQPARTTVRLAARKRVPKGKSGSP